MFMSSLETDWCRFVKHDIDGIGKAVRERIRRWFIIFIVDDLDGMLADYRVSLKSR